jgi:hypothetical protein
VLQRFVLPQLGCLAAERGDDRRADGLAGEASAGLAVIDVPIYRGGFEAAVLARCNAS